MKIIRYEMAITVDGSGTYTGTVQDNGADGVFFGTLLAISYVKHGSNPFDATVDFIIGGDERLFWVESNVSASKVVFPHEDAHGQDGASVDSYGGSPLYYPVMLFDENIGVALVGAGAGNQGTLHFYIDHNYTPRSL